MKTEQIKRSLIFLLFCSFANLYSISYCDSQTTIYTPRGSVVPDVYTRTEFD